MHFRGEADEYCDIVKNISILYVASNVYLLTFRFQIALIAAGQSFLGPERYGPTTYLVPKLLELCEALV